MSGKTSQAGKLSRYEFTYEVTEDMIRRFKRLSPAKKLAWLEDFNRFTHAALTKKQKQFRDKFKQGDL